MLRSTSKASLAGFALRAVAAAGLSGAVAHADAPQGVIFKAEAQVGSRVATPIEIQAGDMTFSSGFWFWSLPMPQVLTDQYGNDLAELTSANVILSDPMEFMTFSLQSLDPSENVILTLTSAQVTFPATNSPMATASPGITVSDSGGAAGAAAAGVSGSKIFQALYHYGTTWGSKSFLSDLTIPGGSASSSEEWPGGGMYAPLPSGVDAMQMFYSFSLTPGDIASGTASFEIIPEPAAGLLAALLLALWRRR
jgi:MYXO-CTERM domain-containing protein